MGSATEFNDASVVNCLTGWIPEPLPLRFGHLSEVWRFLKETLPKYQWPDDKNKQSQDEESTMNMHVRFEVEKFLTNFRLNCLIKG